jgi:hypothetical protein
VSLHPTSTAAETRPAGLAPTLSGFASMPTADRSMRIRDAGVAIEFRAPETNDVAALHTWWRRPPAGCRVALHDDADGAPAELAAAALPDSAAGWLTVPLVAPVVAGKVYHAVVGCEQTSSPRLGYTLDADDSARDAGAWSSSSCAASGSAPGAVPRRPSSSSPSPTASPGPAVSRAAR